PRAVEVHDVRVGHDPLVFPLDLSLASTRRGDGKRFCERVEGDDVAFVARHRVPGSLEEGLHDRIGRRPVHGRVGGGRVARDAPAGRAGQPVARLTARRVAHDRLLGGTWLSDLRGSGCRQRDDEERRQPYAARAHARSPAADSSADTRADACRLRKTMNASNTLSSYSKYRGTVSANVVISRSPGVMNAATMYERTNAYFRNFDRNCGVTR